MWKTLACPFCICSHGPYTYLGIVCILILVEIAPSKTDAKRSWRPSTPLTDEFVMQNWLKFTSLNYLMKPDTVRLGWNHHLCLGRRLRYVNPLGMTQKVVSIIEMTHMYDTRGSFHVLRPKNTIKFVTRSVDKSIRMGKWPVLSLANFWLCCRGPFCTGPSLDSADASVFLG